MQTPPKSTRPSQHHSCPHTHTPCLALSDTQGMVTAGPMSPGPRLQFYQICALSAPHILRCKVPQRPPLPVSPPCPFLHSVPLTTAASGHLLHHSVPGSWAPSQAPRRGAKGTHMSSKIVCHLGDSLIQSSNTGAEIKQFPRIWNPVLLGHSCGAQGPGRAACHWDPRLGQSQLALQSHGATAVYTAPGHSNETM